MVSGRDILGEPPAWKSVGQIIEIVSCLEILGVMFDQSNAHL